MADSSESGDMGQRQVTEGTTGVKVEETKSEVSLSKGRWFDWINVAVTVQGEKQYYISEMINENWDKRKKTKREFVKLFYYLFLSTERRQGMIKDQ